MPIKKLPGGRNRKADKLVFSGVKIKHPPNDVFLFVRRVRSSILLGMLAGRNQAVSIVTCVPRYKTGIAAAIRSIPIKAGAA